MRPDDRSAGGRGGLKRCALDTTPPDDRSAERRSSGSGPGAALFGAVMLLLAGVAGAAAATHFTPATPSLFGVLGLLLGCPGMPGASPVEVFDADDLAMFEDFAEPPP